MQRSAVTYGRDGLDSRLAEHLGDGIGFFVEAGANDGVTESNTLLLEQRGWQGILVEPVPELARRCRGNRPRSVVVEAALVGPAFEAPRISMTYANLMSVVEGARGGPAQERAFAEVGRELQEGCDVYELTVPARTLSSILDEHAATDVDLLSLDVEGYEADALAGLDLERHRPAAILVEVWAWNRRAIGELLARDYDEVAVLGSLHTGEPAPPGVAWADRSFEEILYRRRDAER